MIQDTLLIVLGSALCMEVGSIIKLMLDVMQDKPLKAKYTIVRSCLSFIVGGCIGYFAILKGSNPIKEATPFLILVGGGFFLDTILKAAQKYGPKVIIDSILKHFGYRKIAGDGIEKIDSNEPQNKQ